MVTPGQSWAKTVAASITEGFAQGMMQTVIEGRFTPPPPPPQVDTGLPVMECVMGAAAIGLGSMAVRARRDPRIMEEIEGIRTVVDEVIETQEPMRNDVNAMVTIMEMRSGQTQDYMDQHKEERVGTGTPTCK